ncbi:Uncharacterised protein [Mycobacterium tuberculosis]|nr:Uncharacterised protein [Mycobacterium tuberculosis]
MIGYSSSGVTSALTTGFETTGSMNKVVMALT